MAEIHWEELEICHCSQADLDVSLDVELIYPMDFLGDEPRVGAHRCSNGVMCNQFNQGTCIWSGTNPDVDPFSNS